jgi:hypothetical protein
VSFNQYSQQVVNLFLRAFPEWSDLILQSGDESGVLEFQLEPPSQNIIHGLWVSTDGDEVTVAFHTHHIHFTYYDGHRSFTDHIEGAIEHIQELLSDQIGVISWYQDDRFLCSATFYSENTTALNELLARYLPDPTRIEIRFWSGQKDQDLDLTFVRSQ